MKTIVIDLDGTLTVDVPCEYSLKPPNKEVIDVCKLYKNKGFKIVVATSRNMRTYEGNLGKMNIHTLPGVIAWLDKHGVPYDEIHLGKPWCGNEGFYVDDKAIRPSEFFKLSYDEIMDLLSREGLHKGDDTP